MIINIDIDELMLPIYAVLDDGEMRQIGNLIINNADVMTATIKRPVDEDLTS